MLTSSSLLLIMLLTLFLLGLATFITGIAILVFRASGRDVKTLAAQTTQLAQKGLAEEVAGLVGNASNLVEALNQLTRTTAGIGIIIAVLGLILMGITCWLALQVYQMPL